MNNFDIILLDFDDTLWARNLNNASNLENSLDNIKLLNELAKKVDCKIISGNTYDGIREKISKVISLNDLNFDIWADANSVLYRKDERCGFIEDFSIDRYKEVIFKFLNKYKLKYYTYGYPELVNIKIKPLNDLERDLLVDLFNENIKIGVSAFKTGTTTVDILSSLNYKDNLFYTKWFKDFYKKKSLYIGDECYNGNDKRICKKCTEYINVENVKETNTVLKLLLSE